MTPSTDVVRSLTRPGVRAGLVMDFDGVLAPIVDDPAASRLLDGSAGLLARVAQRLPVVALLSGRPVAFLAERAPVPRAHQLGAYGVERWHDGAVHVLPAVEEWRAAVAAASARLHGLFDAVPGLHVEDKGLAVAVHWRNAPDQAAAERLVDDAVAPLAADSGLHREPGKMVVELRPPLGEDKGSALRRLVAEERLDVVAYAGDDRGDLPAFAAVTELGGHALVVHGPDIAPEVAAVDGTAFTGPEDFQAWLGTLADALDAPTG